jgi:hypothetical protein
VANLATTATSIATTAADVATNAATIATIAAFIATTAASLGMDAASVAMDVTTIAAIATTVATYACNLSKTYEVGSIASTTVVRSPSVRRELALTAATSSCRSFWTFSAHGFTHGGCR